MLCTNCGKEIDDEPVWAVYADPAFEAKRLDSFPLHRDCFEENRTITATAWVPKAIDGAPPRDQFGNTTHEDLHDLVETEQERYREVTL